MAMCNVQFPLPSEEDTQCFDNYHMTHKKRGIAYIFNIENFKTRGLEFRRGSTKDVEDFQNALEKLGFHKEDIKVYSDQTAGQMLDIFKHIKDINSDIDCFVCAILSHGKEQDIIFGHEGEVKLDTLLSYLRHDCCPSLIGIPKLFFVQACRGIKSDNGVGVAVDMGNVQMLPQISIEQDMLVFYSSCVGFPSFKYKDEGSWFMQSLSKVLIKYGTKYEIMRLLTAVSNYVASLEFSNECIPDFEGCKQMPCIMSKLSKQLKFVPKK